MRTTPLAAGTHTPLVNNTVCRGARPPRAAMVACTHDTHCGIAAARRRNTQHALHGCTHNTVRTQARLFSTARRLVPIADRVLVKRVEHKTQTAGGIYLPTEQKVNEADVVAVGPGATDESGKLIPMEVAVGDSVLLPEYGATAVNIGEEEFHLLRASDILGKFEG